MFGAVTVESGHENLHYTKPKPMKISIQHQESYSRGELLLRTFFGFIYIAIPHLLVLLFVAISAMFINLLSFWAILITGKFPRGMWSDLYNMMRWTLRLSARMDNLSDGYPAIGLGGQDDKTSLIMEYPEKSSRGLVLLRTMFGFIYVYIPHMFCLLFLMIAAAFVKMIAFWVVLITGKYPKGMHDFMVGVLRWNMRVSAYMYNMTDTYPPFSLKEMESTNTALDSNI
jgi:hypothetical protein